MTLSPWMIYLADVCTSLCIVANIGLGVCSVFLFVVLVTWPDLRYRLRAIAWTLAACVFVTIFVPSGKVLTAMYVLPPIVNSDAVQKLPDEAVDLMRQYIKDVLKVKDEK